MDGANEGDLFDILSSEISDLVTAKDATVRFVARVLHLREESQVRAEGPSDDGSKVTVYVAEPMDAYHVIDTIAQECDNRSVPTRPVTNGIAARMGGSTFTWTAAYHGNGLYVTLQRTNEDSKPQRITGTNLPL